MCAGFSLDDILKLVQMLFYVATPLIALYGLRSWKHELRGRTEYEVATNVLAGAYRIRDAIKQVQTPFMTPSEWIGRQKKEPESEHETLIYNTFYAFSNRINVVRDAVRDWYPHVVRSEALFGDDAKKATEALAKVANKLWIAIEMWHKEEIRSRTDEGRFTSLYNIMYGIDPSQHPDLPEEARNDNGFHAEFREVMSRIENIFEPHLERGRRRS